MEIKIRKINDHVVEVTAETSGANIDCGMLSLSEQRDLAEHLIYAAEDLLSRNFEYKLQAEILNTVAENLS